MFDASHAFNRFISWIVLVCFYFQTLWPSVVFAADVEVMRPVSPHAFFERYVSEDDDVVEEEGRIAFEIQVDDKNEAFDKSGKRPLAFVPVGKTLEETQRLIDESLSLQSFYPGLKLQADGLSWEQFGYSFLYHFSGNLLVTGNGAKEDRSLVLRLYNPYGSVILGEGLAMDQLRARAHHVIQVERNSIERLDIWAEGDSGSEGVFTNVKEAILNTNHFSLHQGKFLNHGIASLSDGGVLNLYGQDYENHGALGLGYNASLLGVRGLTNEKTGIIQGTTASAEIDTFINHHLVHLTDDFGLNIGNLLRNTHTGSIIIGGNTVVSGTGSILVDEGITEKAGIAIDGNLIFDRFTGALINKGSFVSRQSIQGSLARLYNHKNLALGNFNSLWIQDFFNTGTIQGRGNLRVGQGRNRGLILGSQLAFTIERDFDNEAAGIIETEENLILSGMGRFTNHQHGKIKSPDTQVKIRTFENKADLDLESGKLTVSSEVEQFINAEDAFLNARDLSLHQKGTFTNAGTLSSERLVNLGHHLINTGSIIANVLKHRGHTFHNEAGAEVQVKSLEELYLEELINEGDITITESQKADTFSVKKITNKGTMNLHVLGLFKGDQLFNSGDLKIRGHNLNVRWTHLDTQKKLQFLNTGTTQMTIIRWDNKGTTAFTSLTTFDVQMVVNAGVINGKRDLSGTINHYEGEKDSILRGEQDLSVYGQTLLLTGKILTGRHLHYNAPSFKVFKDGEMVSTKGHLTLSSRTIENHGALVGTEGIALYADLDNYGIVKGEGYKGYFSDRIINHSGGFIDLRWLEKLNILVNEGFIKIRSFFFGTPHISFLQNSGQMEVELGDFSIKDFRNKGIFNLKQGSVSVQSWNNEGGVARIDELSVTMLSSYMQLYLKGKLTANKFKGALKYAAIINEGETTFHSGNLQASRTENSGTFSFRKGRYEVGLLSNASMGTIKIQGGAHVKTNQYYNFGLIEAPKGLIWKVSRIPTKSGKIKTGESKDLIVQITPSLDAPQFLANYAKEWDVGRTLIAETNQFHPVQEVNIPYPFHLKTKSFHNLSKVLAPTLKLETETFSQGKDNSLYGEIKTEGPLSIISQHTVDNRYGKIEGKEKVLVKSLKGDVLTGASVTTYIRKDSRLPPIGCPDGKAFGFSTDEAMPFSLMNEAFFASSGELEIEGVNVAIDFGGLLSQGSVHLKAQHQVRNLSSLFMIGKHLRVTAQEYLHTSMAPTGMNHYNQPNSCSWDEYHYHPSNPAIDQVLGNVYFNVSRVVIDSSHLWVNGDIYDSSNPYSRLKHSEAHPLAIFNVINYTVPFKRTYTKGPCNGSWWNTSYSLVKPEIIYGGTFSMHSEAARFLIMGIVAGKNFYATGKSLETTNSDPAGSSSFLSYKKPQLYGLAEMADEETRINPFYKRNAFGVNLLTSDSRAPQDAYDREKISVFGGMSVPLTAQFYVQRDAANFILNKAFAMFAKNLSIQGTTGTNFVKKLHENAEAEAKRRGKKYLVKEDLETAAASMIVYELTEIEHAPTLMARLLIAPEDVNPYGNTSGSISVTEDIKTHMTDYDISRSGVRKAGRDLECTTDGLLFAETLKDTGSLISAEQTAQWEVARQRAEYIAGRGLKLLGGDVDFTGVGVEGEKVQVKAKRKVTDRPFTLSKSTKDATSASQETISVGSTVKAKTTVEVTAEESDISLMATHIEAPKTILRAINGKVVLLAGVNTSSYSKVEKKANKFWQKITQNSEYHQTYTPCVFTGDVEIESAETNIEAVRGQTLDWFSRIQQKGGPIVYNMLDELHRVESHKVEGLSAAFSMVIALAATIATSGTGASLFGATGAVSSAMANAAFTSLCSQAALSLANNNGNLGQAAKHLTSTEAFKSLGIAMATAGLTKGLGQAMGVPTDPGLAGSVTDHLQREVLRTGVGLAVNAAMGEASDNPLEDGLKGVAVGTAGGVLAGQIGILYGGKQMIDAVTHKVLHAGLGAMMGVALSEDREKGALAGAIGAVTAETVADIVKEDSDVVAGRVLERARAERIPLTPESLNALIHEEIQTTLHVSRLSGAMATMLAGQNVGIGIATATNAVENNATSLMRAGIEKALVGLLAVGTGVGGILAKKQTEDLLSGKMDTIPEDAEWADEGVDTEEARPTVHATPKEDFRPTDRGFTAAPEDLARGYTEGFNTYDGPDTSVLEKAIRSVAIPKGSKLEYIAPGRIRFDGVEFRAVRDLGHLSEEELRYMASFGNVPKTECGEKLQGHHHQQRYHREEGAFVVEIPISKHKISNKNQHPLGISGGLGAWTKERSDWNKLRESFHKERAKAELEKRGLNYEG